MEIEGGALEFDVIANTGQIDQALEQTKQKVSSFTFAVKNGGEQADAAFSNAKAAVERGWHSLDAMMDTHKAAIARLKTTYNELGEQISLSLSQGTAKGDATAMALTQKQQAIKSEIAIREQLLGEIYKTGDALTQEESKLNNDKAAYDKATSAHVSFRTQLMNVRSAMRQMMADGQQNTEQFRQLQAETVRLTRAMNLCNQQTRVLASPRAGFMGVVSGLTGLSGAFSAVQGMMGMFTSKSENMQKVMMKVQSLMAITIGLQQVQQTLYQSSAFRLNTLVKIQGAFHAMTYNVGKALIFMGTSANTARLAASALTATLTVGLSVAIAAIIAAIHSHNKAVEEQKKKIQEEVEMESDARKEMIKGGFELNNYVTRIKTFNGTKEEEKKLVDELNKKYGETFGTFNTLNQWYITLTKNATAYVNMLFNQAKIQSLLAKAEKQDDVVQTLKKTPANLVKGARSTTGNTVANIGNTLLAGEAGTSTENALKNQLSTTQKDIDKFNEENKNKALTTAESIKQNYLDEAAKLQQGVNNISDKLFQGADKDAKKSAKTNSKDPFLAGLEKKKKDYAEYGKWINSTDADIRKAAATNFADLLKEGSSYTDYLTKLREKLQSQPQTKTNSKNLQTVTSELVTSNKSTYMDDFKKSLEGQINAASTLTEKINILTEAKKNLSASDSLQSDKSEVISELDKNVTEEYKDKLQQIRQDFVSFTDQRIAIEKSFTEDMSVLEMAFIRAVSQEEIQATLRTIDVRKKAYKQSLKDLQADEVDSILSNNQTYMDLFKTSIQSSEGKLKQTLDTAKQIISVVNTGIGELPKGIDEKVVENLKKSPKELKNLYDLVDRLQERYKKKANLQIPFYSNIKEAIEKFKELKEEMKDNTLSSDERDKKKVEFVKAGAQAIVGAALEANAAWQEMLKAQMQLAESTGDDKMKENAEQWQSFSENLQAAGEGFEKTGSWIGAVAYGAIDMIKQTVQAFRTAKLEQAEMEQNRKDFLREYGLLLLQLSDEWDTAWGDRGFEKVADAATKAKTALAKYNALVDANTSSTQRMTKTATSLGAAMFGGILTLGGAGWEPFFGFHKKVSNEYKTIMAAYKKGYNDLQAMAVKTRNYSGWANFWGKQDKYQSLYDIAPELWHNNINGEFDTDAAEKFLDTNTQISKAQRQQIQQAIDLKKAYDEAMKAIDDEINSTFSYLGDDVVTALKDSINSGADAWETFRSKGVQAVEAIGEKLAFETYIAESMDNFKASIKKIYANTDMTAQEKATASITAMANFFDTTKQGMADAEDFMAQFKKQAAAAGWNIWNDAGSSTSASGALSTASQESINLLAGQTNAVRVNQIESMGIMRNQLINLSQINNKMSQIYALLGFIYNKLGSSSPDSLRAAGITY